MAEFSKEDQCSFVKIQVAHGQSVQDITQQLAEACGDVSFKERTVRKWAARFHDGSSSTKDMVRSGRPTTAVVEDNYGKVEQLMEQDRRWTCAELSKELLISEKSVHRILTEQLKMRKICSRWVPHCLSDEQKRNRVQIARQLRLRHRREGDAFLNRIVTLDETWARAYEPELKSQSSEWHHEDSPPKSRPKKFRQGPSLLKQMLIVAYDRSGIILVHSIAVGRTVNSQYYHDFLQNNLRAALRKKRPHLLEDLILLHDNATPHTAHVVQDLIDSYGWEILPHPAYSPDLSPCNFHLFPAFKMPMRGTRYNTLDEIKTAANHYTRQVVADTPAGGISQLPGRWNRVIESNGDYFEGF